MVAKKNIYIKKDFNIVELKIQVSQFFKDSLVVCINGLNMLNLKFLNSFFSTPLFIKTSMPENIKCM